AADLVYVVVPGILEEIFVKPGQHVEKGQQLARLSSPDVELAIADLKSKAGQLGVRLQNLLRSQDEAAPRERAQLQQSLAAIQEELRHREEDRQRLTLTAPASGTVLPPPDIPNKPESDSQLPSWTGNPFEKKNLRAFLAESVLFCEIGDPRRLEARLVVEQDNLEF